jgi:hypothetical protein
MILNTGNPPEQLLCNAHPNDRLVSIYTAMLRAIKLLDCLPASRYLDCSHPILRIGTEPSYCQSLFRQMSSTSMSYIQKVAIVGVSGILSTLRQAQLTSTGWRSHRRSHY